MCPQTAAPDGVADPVIVEWIIEQAAPLPAARRHPALVLLVGAPGTGKSTFARELRTRSAIAVVESDAVRERMFAAPTHEKDESGFVFGAIHEALRTLLGRGLAVAVDATNLIESERAVMYRIADETEARLIMVRLTAPAAVVRERLAAAGGARSASRAGVAAFEEMRVHRRPILRPHYVVDTVRGVDAAADTIAKEIERT